MAFFISVTLGLELLVARLVTLNRISGLVNLATYIKLMMIDRNCLLSQSDSSGLSLGPTTAGVDGNFFVPGMCLLIKSSMYQYKN